MLIRIRDAQAADGEDGVWEAQKPGALLPAFFKGNIMRALNSFELQAVSGADGGDEFLAYTYTMDMTGGNYDAASTRVSTGAGWGGGNGGSGPGTNSICYTVQTGPLTSQTCYNNDGTTSVQNCLNVGPAASVGGVGAGVTVNVCNTPTP